MEVDHEADAGRFRITAYPFKPEWHPASELQEAWDGPALLVAREPIPDLSAQSKLASAGPWATGRAVGLGMAVVAVLYLGYVNLKGRRGRTPTAGSQAS